MYNAKWTEMTDKGIQQRKSMMMKRYENYQWMNFITPTPWWHLPSLFLAWYSPQLNIKFGFYLIRCTQFRRNIVIRWMNNETVHYAWFLAAWFCVGRRCLIVWKSASCMVQRKANKDDIGFNKAHSGWPICVKILSSHFARSCLLLVLVYFLSTVPDARSNISKQKIQNQTKKGVIQK